MHTEITIFITQQLVPASMYSSSQKNLHSVFVYLRSTQIIV